MPALPGRRSVQAAILWSLPLEPQSQSELKLPRVGRTRGPSKGRQRCCPLTERIVRQLQVSPVEEIEGLRDNFHSEMLGETDTAAQPHVERSKVKAFAGIPRNPNRPIVNACVE